MAQSYSNHAGSGIRAAYVVCTTSSGLTTGPPWHLVEGDTTSNNQIFFNAVTVDSSVFIKFDFKTNRIVDEAKFYQENTTSHGTWKWQGSTDDSNWTDIGSSFTLGGSATQTQTQLNGNTTPYRWYRLLGVSGTTSTNPWVYEFEFQIDSETAVDVSYANTGGEGNRGSGITVTTTQSLGAGAITTLVNGNLIEQTLFFTGGSAVSGNEIKFDFGSGASKIITEATWFQNNANSSGTWKWQGSNDNSNWTDIGSSFTLGNATQNIHTSLSGNTTGYRYYRLLGVSGNASSSPWLYEIAFQIGDAPSGQTVSIGQVTETDTAQSFTRLKTNALGLNTETDLSQSIINPQVRVTQVTADVIATPDSKIRDTQVTADVIGEGEHNALVTQVYADVIADVIAHVDQVRVTQVTIDVIGEPDVHILTPSPLANPFVNEPYSVTIVATGGLGMLTFSLKSGNITNVTQADPAVVTSNGHGLVDGQKILITGVVGMTQLNGNYYYVDVLTPNTFALYLDAALTMPVDSTGFTAYSSGGIWTHALPAGLTLNPATRVISGTPTETGTFNFTIIVTDSVGNTDSVDYTFNVDFINQPGINLGIGVFGLGYTVQRGFSGIEAHIEITDVGFGTAAGSTKIYGRSQFFFPRNDFPEDQKFFLEMVGGNTEGSPLVWRVFNNDYSQTITQSTAGGRIRNAAQFMGPQGIYKVESPAVTVTNNATADAFRIVAPLRAAQAFVSEVRLCNSAQTTLADQELGSGDAFRTSNSGRAETDDGWTSTGMPVFRFEAAAWEHLKSATLILVGSHASFDSQNAFKYSEIAFVDIDDIAEYGYSRKISTQNMNIFFIPTLFTIDINPTSLRDGHRYQIYARSVKPDGFFSFNVFLNTARLHLAMEPGNNAEIYNRCGPFRRTYLFGKYVPDPEIYFQLNSAGTPETRNLEDLGPSTVLGNSAGLGTGSDVTESEITTVAPNEVYRSQELSEFLIAGHDYESGTSNQAEIVYRFTDVLRKPKHSYMF